MRLVKFGCGPWAALGDQTLNLFLGGNAELIGYLQRICGYALVGLVRDNILPIAHGDGNNGKSTILETLLAVFGPDYSWKCSPDLLMAKNHDVHPTVVADLFHKRLVIAIETAQGRSLNESLVKDLTGGDSIWARRMREDGWDFAPTHTLIMATNHVPVIRGTDEGIWRRLKLLPFNVSVKGAQDDQTMREKLSLEHAGILAWCVRGCLEWQANGLGEPPVVKQETSGYRSEQDVIGNFLEAYTVQGPEYRIRCNELYDKYKQTALTSGGVALMSFIAFGKAMKKREIETQRSNGMWYIGVALRTI